MWPRLAAGPSTPTCGSAAAVPAGEAWRQDPRRPKQLASFQRVGRRITGGRCDDASRGDRRRPRLAYVEVLSDKQKVNTIGFQVRAVGWFSAQGR